LNVNEVLAPDAKSRICGLFKGAPVYRRSDVHTALVAKKWLYQGRKVKEDGMGTPVKRVKARTKAAPKGFQPLRSYGVGEGNDGSEEARQKEMQKATKPNENDDGMDNLYAHWQTVPWSPLPVGPNDPIPVNEYSNIELELLNPGLEHLVECPRWPSNLECTLRDQSLCPPVYDISLHLLNCAPLAVLTHRVCLALKATVVIALRQFAALSFTNITRQF
jgi:hypothetical protein